MKTWSMMAAMLVLALSATLATAADSTAAKAGTVKGKIMKIDGANVTVQPVALNDGTVPAAVTFATGDKTVVYDGTPNKGVKKAVSDLAVDQMVYVKLSADGKTAVTISIIKITAK